MPDETEVDEFARLFTRFLERMQQSAPRSSRESLRDRLRAHLGVDPEQVPVVSASFPPYDLPNVQRAIEAWFESFEVLGLAGSDRGHHSLGELLELAEYDRFGIGAVDYQRLQIDVDEDMDCVAFGFYLGVRGEDRYVALLRAANPQYGRGSVELEVLAVEKAAGDRFLGALPGLIREHNVFRGKVVSFEGHEFGQGVGPFRLHPRPGITRADVVLPDGVLERIEREVVGIAAHRETLLAAGQHLRRGVLLYGPPGTGKTHTIRYVLSQLPDFTVVLLAGTSIHFISQACALARMLQPALVVLEDCDLVAEARDYSRGAENPLLFQVLNEMDGLAQDADVAFLLTTNRADLLEPALMQRPGRVDMAVEVPLPDADGRGRLLRLYGPGLELSAELVDEIVEQTAGTTASFMKELVRRTVLLAAEAGEAPGADHLRAAVAELLSSRDTLTRRLLGATGSEPSDDQAGAAEPPGPGTAPEPGMAGPGAAPQPGATPGLAGPSAGAGRLPKRGPMPGVYKGFIG
ncbi:AAA family ATPase [Kribbella pratensis]|uniref:ATPase family protein associated with various cellular activities (AAA) n=1 Tax=Kribbella pratensis TaxID=2512112 RepID=A0A4R8CJB0_9ACTN|nr:ATP-binding protein [Kribbella pratensis]TDW76304.1 ATPase family protein associated with various cellular activities (AAA) [Kribbella pratensis]